jgi:pyrroloquinoline-quinone synthase
VTLVDRLCALESHYHDRHPFHRRMNSGSLDREELQRWVANRYCYQAIIPRKDAAILSNCDEPAIRRLWVQRILDHDGHDGAQGGLESWLMLGEALGVPRAQLIAEELVLPGVRYAVEAYLGFCRRRPWIEGVASSLTELFGPGAIRERLEALERHYPWIDPAALHYFRERLSLAPRDAQQALEIVVARCTSADEQDRAVRALEFKCDVLWAQLDAIAAGETRIGAGR